MIWALDARSFPVFFAIVLALFLIGGVGNASTFQRVQGIIRAEVSSFSKSNDPEER